MGPSRIGSTPTTPRSTLSSPTTGFGSPNAAALGPSLRSATVTRTAIANHHHHTATVGGGSSGHHRTTSDMSHIRGNRFTFDSHSSPLATGDDDHHSPGLLEPSVSSILSSPSMASIRSPISMMLPPSSRMASAGGSPSTTSLPASTVTRTTILKSSTPTSSNNINNGGPMLTSTTTSPVWPSSSSRSPIISSSSTVTSPPSTVTKDGSFKLFGTRPSSHQRTVSALPSTTAAIRNRRQHGHANYDDDQDDDDQPTLTVTTTTEDTTTKSGSRSIAIAPTTSSSQHRRTTTASSQLILGSVHNSALSPTSPTSPNSDSHHGGVEVTSGSVVDRAHHAILDHNNPINHMDHTIVTSNSSSDPRHHDSLSSGGESIDHPHAPVHAGVDARRPSTASDHVANMDAIDVLARVGPLSRTTGSGTGAMADLDLTATGGLDHSYSLSSILTEDTTTGQPLSTGVVPVPVIDNRETGSTFAELQNFRTNNDLPQARETYRLLNDKVTKLQSHKKILTKEVKALQMTIKLLEKETKEVRFPAETYRIDVLVVFAT
jgi:hypothetical protein